MIEKGQRGEEIKLFDTKERNTQQEKKESIKKGMQEKRLNRKKYVANNERYFLREMEKKELFLV